MANFKDKLQAIEQDVLDPIIQISQHTLQNIIKKLIGDGLIKPSVKLLSEVAEQGSDSFRSLTNKIMNDVEDVRKNHCEKKQANNAQTRILELQQSFFSLINNGTWPHISTSQLMPIMIEGCVLLELFPDNDIRKNQAQKFMKIVFKVVKRCSLSCGATHGSKFVSSYLSSVPTLPGSLDGIHFGS